MDQKRSLIQLVTLQRLAIDIRNARETIEGGPARLEEIEERFRERNVEYVAVKDRFDELEADQKERNAELTELEEFKKKYMADLMQVTNQREYSAMLKEIDAVKAKISTHEEAVLKAMEECEKLKPELESHAEHIEAERVKDEAEKAEVHKAVEEAKERLSRGETERVSLEAEIPDNLLSTVHRLEAGRQGIFMAKVVDGSCQMCFVRVRPQAFQEIKLGTGIHLCSQCKRFLYYEPTLETEPAGERGGEAADQSEPTSVEAADGGAV